MKKIIEYQDDNELLSKLQLLIKEKVKHLSSPHDAYELFKKHACDEQESFMMTVLNGAHESIETLVITKGLVNRTIVHPREIFRPAIRLNGCAVILCHNHPSGNMEPSLEDIQLTKRLKEAGELIGIPVLDHLIISKYGFISMVENGSMPL